MMMKFFVLCLALVAVADAARPITKPLKVDGISPTAVTLPGPKGSAVREVTATSYEVTITVKLSGTGVATDTISMATDCKKPGLEVSTSSALVPVGASSVTLTQTVNLVPGGPATPHCQARVLLNGAVVNGEVENIIWKIQGASGARR